MENLNKKVKLIIIDFLNKYKDYKVDDLYLELYSDLPKAFQQIFAYFHQNLNESFDFMNKKAKINHHYNADDSRFLINLIDDLFLLKRSLDAVNFNFNIEESYLNQISYVQTFLIPSGGSPIPENYITFNIKKYDPIFFIKTKIKDLKNIDVTDPSISITKANFESNKVVLTINKDILLHVKSLLETGHYFNAVEESYKIVRKKLRDITGKEKATEAFAKDNYEIIFGHRPRNDIEKDFFEGVKFLHMAIQFLRNEKSHTPSKEIDKNLALHYIALSSLAYDLISRNNNT